jgi:hypothetical protein
MIAGNYHLSLTCGNGADCAGAVPPRTADFWAYNSTRARAEARRAGWLFKDDDVLCPACAKAFERKPRYPGRTLA